MNRQLAELFGFQRVQPVVRVVYDLDHVRRHMAALAPIAAAILVDRALTYRICT